MYYIAKSIGTSNKKLLLFSKSIYKSIKVLFIWAILLFILYYIIIMY